MQGCTAAFQAALASGSQVVASKVEVLDPTGKVIASSDSTASPALLVDDGSVSVDRAQAYRRRCDLRLVDPTGSIVPAAATDLLSVVSGNEVRLWRGLALPGVAAPEYKALGTFGLGRVQVADSAKGVGIALTAYDRSRAVDRNRWASPYVVAAGGLATDVLQAIILDRRPGTAFRVTASAHTLPRLVFDEQASPWTDSVKGIADSMGYEVFFAPDGVCVIQPVPDPAAAPVVASYVEGPQMTITDLSKDMDNERVYNYVVLSGENTTNTVAVRGSAWDSDPRSPTYAGNPEAVPPIPPGPYGLVPYFEASPFITTVAQGQAAAAGRVRNLKGVPEVLAWNGLVNPCHEESDVVHVTRAISRVNAEYSLDALTIPLRARDGMRATARERRVA
jgi:hypothetical protein